MNWSSTQIGDSEHADENEKVSRQAKHGAIKEYILELRGNANMPLPLGLDRGL